jgi:hypothetical protein
MIHLYRENFLNQYELAQTLIHEAYHAYFNSRDQMAAELTAQACVLDHF